MNLTEHFTLSEMIFSERALRVGMDNTPSADQLTNLQRVCEFLLEPARSLLAVPLHINSGFRSRAVNESVGGDPDSYHMDGLAADVVPIGFPIEDAFDLLCLAPLPYDKIIFECRAWIHIALPRGLNKPRRIAETASGSPGDWHYNLVAGVS